MPNLVILMHLFMLGVLSRCNHLDAVNMATHEALFYDDLPT